VNLQTRIKAWKLAREYKRATLREDLASAESAIIDRYYELFPTNTFVTLTDAVDYMAREVFSLREELCRYRDAHKALSAEHAECASQLERAGHALDARTAEAHDLRQSLNFQVGDIERIRGSYIHFRNTVAQATYPDAAPDPESRLMLIRKLSSDSLLNLAMGARDSLRAKQLASQPLSSQPEEREHAEQKKANGQDSHS
jgi:hypothetical protein